MAGFVLTSTTRPPSAAAIVRASASPSPVPSGRPLTLRSKIRDTSSGGDALALVPDLDHDRTSALRGLQGHRPAAVHERVIQQRGEHLGQPARGDVSLQVARADHHELAPRRRAAWLDSMTCCRTISSMPVRAA